MKKVNWEKQVNANLDKIFKILIGLHAKKVPYVDITDQKKLPAPKVIHNVR